MEVIKVDNVSKSFKIYYDKGQSFKERILFKNRNRHEVHKVLKGISLSIKKGEVVGLIGENGSGKSTLLKLMTKIIYPDTGDIKIKGKVSSLLELGAGFHPDMTGRENIYINASIFGLNKKEIDDRLEKIIEFSELGEFIDNPVRTYSSGMYMRLAFSVAINVDADILLVDEILAVGDVNFQKKCFEKIIELKRLNTTIIIVSHDLGSIEKICNKVIWLKSGKMIEADEPQVVIYNYLKSMNDKLKEKIVKNNEINVNKDNKNRWGNKEIEILNVYMKTSEGKKKNTFNVFEDITIEINYKKNMSVDSCIFGIGIFTEENIQCYGTNTDIDKVKINSLKEKGKVSINISSIGLLSGKYYLDIAIHSQEGMAYDYFKKVIEFEMLSEKNEVGIISIKHTWNIN